MRSRMMGVRVTRVRAIESVCDQLISYGGLELPRHYFELSDLNRCIWHGLCKQDHGGNYGCVHLVLWEVGARRLNSEIIPDSPTPDV